MAQIDMQKEITSRSGMHYFFAGWRLIMLPGIKRYVLLPLLVNIALLGGAFWWLYRQLSQWLPQLMSYVPDWLHWLNYLLWPLCVLAVLLVFGYFFSTVANVIAAPFSGLLAERLEMRLTPDSGLVDLVRDTPRMLQREWVKLCYYLPRALILLALHFIPAIGRWCRCCGFCSAPGCWRFNIAIIPLITIRSLSRRCAPRSGVIRWRICGSAHW